MIKKTFEELKLTGQLPSPPGVGMKILKLTEAEDVSADEIARTIMADSALTGRLLKIANSAQSGSQQAITTVAEATVRLGMHSVRNIALGLSLVSTYRSGVCENFDFDRYWSASIARAVAAQGLSRLTRRGTPAGAYVLGLLSEIGYLALASVYPAEYSATLAACGTRQPLELGRAERERFEIDHSEVGAYLLEEWGLPQSYSQAVQAYEQAERASAALDPEARDLAQLLRAAHLIAEICLADESMPKSEWKRLANELESLRGELSLPADEFNAACNSIIREWKEWGSILDLPTQDAIDFAHLAEHFAANAEPSVVLQADPVSAAVQAVAAPIVGLPAGLRVLAVDDDPVSLKLLERHLVNSGHQVRCASDGGEALKIALETNPQVVIADWMMPKTDGIELCKALRRIECGRDMFFLLLTGRDDEDRIVQAFDAGVDDYIVKPFNPRLLSARLKGGQRVIELKERVENDRKTLLKQAAELGLLNRKLRTAALTDVLTDLPNRRYVIKRVEQEWESSSRLNRPMSILMIDIDHFKKINDLFGHDVGDLVLKETAGVLRTTTRQGEEAARLGGEEFLVICPNTTAQQASICAERIRIAIEEHAIQAGSVCTRVTVSLGVAEREASMRGIDALLKAADDAVYAAKKAGRNRTALSPTKQAQIQSA